MTAVTSTRTSSSDNPPFPSMRGHHSADTTDDETSDILDQDDFIVGTFANATATAPENVVMLNLDFPNYPFTGMHPRRPPTFWLTTNPQRLQPWPGPSTDQTPLSTPTPRHSLGDSSGDSSGAVQPPWLPTPPFRPVPGSATESGEALFPSITQAALQLWDGNPEAAHAYLQRPSSLHGGLAPLDAAAQSPGAALRVLSVVRSALAKIAETRRRATDADDDLRTSATPGAVANAALELWGNPEQAETFLNTPHSKLHDRSPQELAAESTDGALAALRLIQQIQDGAPV